MSKVACIPDTSALENLRGIIIGGRDIRYWLVDELEVLLTEKILDEYEEGCQKLGVKDPLVSKLRKHAESVELEESMKQSLKNLAGHSLSKFQDGELTGVRLGLRLLKADNNAVKHIIFLSDDRKAFERSQWGKEILKTMRAFCHWTSADFIIYLAFRLGARGGVGMRKEDFCNALETAVQHMCEPVLKARSGTPIRQVKITEWQSFKDTCLARFEKVYEGSFIGW